jgi:hypothetical protein
LFQLIWGSFRIDVGRWIRVVRCNHRSFSPHTSDSIRLSILLLEY